MRACAPEREHEEREREDIDLHEEPSEATRRAPWYAERVPRGESPARDARAGAALARAQEKLDGWLKDGLGKLNVRIAPPERGSAFAALARRASADAADMLRLAAAGACDLACTRAAAVAAWGAGAERAVRAWALARASESDWEAILDVVGHAHPQRATARAQLETLAQWAAQGPDLQVRSPTPRRG